MVATAPADGVNEPAGDATATAAADGSPEPSVAGDATAAASPEAADEAHSSEDMVGAPEASAQVPQHAPLSKALTSINDDFQFSVTEHEAHRTCGGSYAAWSVRSLSIAKGDTVKFSWLKKGRSLTVHKGKTEVKAFNDPDNTRIYLHTFAELGTYRVTCFDGDVKFVIKISCSTPEVNFRYTVIRSLLQFGLLGGVLIGGSAVGTAALLNMNGISPENQLEDNAESTARNIKNLQDIAYNHSRVPATLATIMIVVAPLMGLYSWLKPTPLSSYGRGFEYATHVNMRTALCLLSFSVFGVVMWAWGSYGDNGNAMELVMEEVSGLAVYCAEQLGGASGSLGVALGSIVVLPGQSFCTKGSEKNPTASTEEDCETSSSWNWIPVVNNEYDSELGGEAIVEYECWELQKDKVTSKLLTNEVNCEFNDGEWHWGSPGVLEGKLSACPNYPDIEDKEFGFCATQIILFAKLSSMLVGEEAAFKDDPATTALLQKLGEESVNSASYANMGEQAISSLMRVRMILIYFVMQISLVAAALCAAGGFRSKQKLIKSGGWTALIGLIIVLFSYSVNIIIAKLVDQAVTALKKANDGEGDGDSPMVQLLAYCKPQEDGACDSSIDLSFAAELASSITCKKPPADDGSSGCPAADCISPSEIQQQISLASSQMSATQQTIFGSESLLDAMGAGTNMLPIIGNIFSAVGNIIDIIDCKVAYQSFQRMLVILDEKANTTFKSIATAELTLAFVLGALFCLARFTAYILDRPRKLFCCLETGRWFRFKAAYKAHVTLLNKKKKFGAGDLLKFVPVPHFSFMSIAMEIALVFHIGLFLLIPNAFMALGGSGFRGVPDVVPYTLLATSFVGLSTTWSMSKSCVSLLGCMFAVLCSLAAAALCAAAAIVEVMDTNECFQLMQQANAEAAAANAAAADDDAPQQSASASAMAIQGVVGSNGMACDFASITDSVQSTIFCLVCMLLCLLTFLAGLCFLCARNHMMTDTVRKTMLKLSTEGTKEGAKNKMIESMGGHRTDGLGGSGMQEIRVKVKRLTASRWFQVCFIIALAGGAAGAGMMFKQIQDDIEANAPKTWQFNKCSEDEKHLCCNGLKENCDKPVNDVVFAGIHNSMSSAQDNWLAPNNFYREIGALDKGYRGLMIDLYMFDPDGASCTTSGSNPGSNCEVYSCHGLCMFGNTRTLDEFRNITNWLNEPENSNEVLMMVFETYNEDSDLNKWVYQDMEELGWVGDDATTKAPGLIKKKEDGTWPTMRESIDANKRIIFITMANCEATSEWCGPDKGIYSASDDTYDTQYHIQNTTNLEKEGCKILEPPRGTINKNNFFIMNHFMTNPVASPSFAQKINWDPYLGDRVKQCEEYVGARVNFIAVDFWSIGDAVKVAQEMNVLPLPAAVPEEDIELTQQH